MPSDDGGGQTTLTLRKYETAEAVITDTQSYGMVIRDMLYAKAVTLPFFAGFKSRRSQATADHAQKCCRFSASTSSARA